MEICCRSRWENGGSRGKSQEHATTPTQINYVDVGGSELRWCREVAGGEVGWAYTESSQPSLIALRLAPNVPTVAISGCLDGVRACACKVPAQAVRLVMAHLFSSTSTTTCWMRGSSDPPCTRLPLHPIGAWKVQTWLRVHCAHDRTVHILTARYQRLSART